MKNMVKTKRFLWVLNPLFLRHWGFGVGGGRMRAAMFANHVNNRFEEDLLIKVGSIEHPTVWQAFVNWQRGLAPCPAKGSEGEENFHIFLLDQFSDLLFQALLLGPCIRKYKVLFLTGPTQNVLNVWGWQKTLPKSESAAIKQQDVKF